MPERPKWYKHIYEKYRIHGLGTIIVDNRGHYQFTTDNSEDSKPQTLMNVLDDIDRDVKGLEFLESHPKVPRKWRTWIAKNKNTF